MTFMGLSNMAQARQQWFWYQGLIDYPWRLKIYSPFHSQLCSRQRRNQNCILTTHNMTTLISSCIHNGLIISYMVNYMISYPPLAPSARTSMCPSLPCSPRRKNCCVCSGWSWTLARTPTNLITTLAIPLINPACHTTVPCPAFNQGKRELTASKVQIAHFRWLCVWG